MRWLSLFTPGLSGRENMALDNALYRAMEAGFDQPVFRLYTWREPTLSLGYSQSAEQELDTRALAGGVPVVNRLTGGRAVLHAGEITYSAVLPLAWASWSGTRAASYEMISRGILQGLQNWVPDLALERSALQPEKLPSAAAPCFASSARSEIVWQGKKLVGSAQRRGRRALLQHGSILLDSSHAEIVNFQKYSRPEKNRQRAFLQEKSISLEQIRGEVLRADQMVDVLNRSFFAVLGDAWEPVKKEDLEKVSSPQPTAGTI